MFSTFYISIFSIFVSFANAICHQDNDNFTEKDILIIQGEMPEKMNQWNHYGKPFDNFKGVDAISNRESGKGGYYQCTELVHRFVTQFYGLQTRLGMGMGHGKDLAENIARKFSNSKFQIKSNSLLKGYLIYFKSGCSSVPPTVGSIVSFNKGPFGHVAIVREAQRVSPNEIRVFLFEQHGDLAFVVGNEKPVRNFIVKKNESGYWHHEYTAGWVNPMRK